MLTPEQLLARKEGIGGSDAAAIVGLSNYSTALDVYLDKTTPTVEEKVYTRVMDRGNALEPFVASLFCARTGWRVNMGLATMRNKKRPFMLANLDGFISSENALVEFKTANYAAKTNEDWGEEGTDEIPKSYLIQVAHYAEVTEVDTVYIGVLFGNERLFKSYALLYKCMKELGSPIIGSEIADFGLDFRIYKYTRHPTLARKLISREKQFWFDHVQKKVPPAPKVGIPSDFLKAYPIALNRIVTVSDEENTISIQRLRDVKQQIKILKQEEESLKANVLSLFKEASVLVDVDGNPLATWRNRDTSYFDKAALLQENPELCEEYVTKKQTRVLNVI